MKPKLLFIYKVDYEIRDGLYAALELLREDFSIFKSNLGIETPDPSEYDIVLGWGVFDSEVEKYVLTSRANKKALCIGGVTRPHKYIDQYDVLFYETEWYKPQIESHRNIVHAFGVNTNIMKPLHIQMKLWDYMTCGAFSIWKRQWLLANRPGNKIAIGDIQLNNLTESMQIVAKLLAHGVAVSNQVDEETLCKYYNLSDTVYIPAEVYGGGERAVLEARACGVNVEVEDDNPKLQELLDSPIYDHHYYYRKLKEGLLSIL